jgi:PPM family protein phosphatase
VDSDLGLETTPLLDVDAAAEKNIGGRPYDEDAVLVRPDLRLFAVADGAGGENGGNLASSIAIASIARHFEGTRESIGREPLFDVLGLLTAARRLATAIVRANRDVLEIARTASRYRGMASTVVAISPDFEQGVVHVSHVGDSRCYRMRAGRLEQLTLDHSLANDVLELRPDLSDAEAARLPRNVITRALGMLDNVRVTTRTLDMAPGYTFLLCSDGLTDALSDEDIAETLLSARSVGEQARELVARSLGEGADDNLTALVVKVEASRGVVTVPKRHATRPPPGRKKAVPAPSSMPPDDSDDPEIVLVDDDEPEIHVLGDGPLSASGRDALSGWQQQTSKRFPRPPKEDAE